MAALDAYHRWLGIPPREQPPHHYRLLGLDLFEEDREVIRDAAERQIAHVRTYQLGPHSQLSQRLLNELATARACLSEPAAKAQYDRQLRERLAAAAESPPMATPVRQGPPPVPLAAVRKASAIGAGWRWIVPLGAAAAALAALAVLAWAVWPREAPPSAEPNASAPPPPEPPGLTPVPDLTVSEGRPIRVLLTAPGEPPESLRFRLDEGAPPGAAIHPKTGEFTWMPSEEQGPGDYRIRVLAVREGENQPPGETTFGIHVGEVNEAPVIQPLAPVEAQVGQPARAVVVVHDPDLPPNKLTLRLIDGPPGTELAATSPGTWELRWQPRPEEAGKSYQATLEATDDGQPPLADRWPLTMTVRALPVEPAPAAKPAPAAAAVATPVPLKDDRLPRMRQVLDSVAPLFQAWKTAADQLQKLMIQGQAAQAQVNDLVGQINSLQRQIQSYDLSRRAAQSNNDSGSADNYSNLIAGCQRQIAALQGPLQAATAEKNRLEQSVLDTRRQQAESVKQAESGVQAWIALCDPLGRWPREGQQQVVQQAGQWIEQYGDLWLPYLARACARINLGDYPPALGDVEKVRELNQANPRMNAFAAAVRGYVFTRQGDSKKALAEFTKALKFDPKLPITYVLRGRMYAQDHRYTSAAEDLRKAVRMADGEAETHAALAWLQATSPSAGVRNGKEAVDHATRACELSAWRLWPLVDILAAAYAEAGDFPAAIKYENQALGQAPAGSQPPLRERLALYQAGKPYRTE